MHVYIMYICILMYVWLYCVYVDVRIHVYVDAHMYVKVYYKIIGV